MNRINIVTCIGFVFVILFSNGCKSENEEDLVMPVFQHASLSDGAVGVDVTTNSIDFYFDVDIDIITSSNISLNGDRLTEASVSGHVLSVSLPKLSANTNYSVVLQSNTVKAKEGEAYSSVIKLDFKTATIITGALATVNPSNEVKKVYDYLRDNYGKKILSSIMANVNWNIKEAEWVHLHIGKYPAIAAFDYIHFIESPAGWIDYSNVAVLEDWWNSNGLIAIGWHWRVPTQEGASTYTYKPEETTFRISNAILDGTWENAVVKSDLLKIANYLKLLQAKNIPVIWRPLHEAAGNIYNYSGGKAWFWWGAEGSAPFKALWKYMFDYFQSQGINNLIWVWTTQTKDDAFYPGDDYVDIIGRDMYNKTDGSVIENEFDLIQKTYPTKMVTLSECGGVAAISDQWELGAKWSYFMPWYDYNRTKDISNSDFSSPEHIYANIDWWNDAKNSKYVIFRDEMPSLK